MEDVAEAVAPQTERRIVGKRPGEKLHECMLSADEAATAVQLPDRYTICPTAGRWTQDRYCQETGATPVASNFAYESGTNSDWLTIAQIKQMMQDVSDTQ